MNKVWIASILATLMLMISLTSVVGANEVEDCNCNPTISDSQVARIEKLLDRLESRINFILLKYGHISEVAEKCLEIFELVNSDNLKGIFCDAIETFTYFIMSLRYIVGDVLWGVFFGPFWVLLMGILILYCDWPYALNINGLKNL